MSRERALLSASMMCANALHLDRDLRAVEEAGVDYLHIDFMDGHFVPNLGMGFDLTKQLRYASELPLDVHLMVSNPEALVPRILDELSPGIVTFHVETTAHGVLLAQKIRERGVLAGIALNPGTPLCLLESLLEDIDFVLVMTVNPGFAGQRLVPSTLEKIRQLRRRLDESGRDLLIGVDGNVSFEHGPRMRAAGANLFVCGTSSLFREDLGIARAAEQFRRALAEAVR